MAHCTRVGASFLTAHPPPAPPPLAALQYTAIFGIVLPLGFFAQFFIGAILDGPGTVWGIWSLWGLAVLFSALNLAAPLAGQPAAFLAFAFFRGFIFSNMSSYHARVFGFAHIGKTIGLTVLAGGLVSLLQQALLQWAFAAPAPEAGDFRGVNSLMLALELALVSFPVWLTLRSTACRRGHGEGRGQEPPETRGAAGEGCEGAATAAVGMRHTQEG